MRGSTPHIAAGGSNAEPAEDSARDAASGEAAGLPGFVDHYADPSQTERVSASSALEPREEGTLDISHSLRVSASEFTRRGRRNEVSGNTAYTPAPIITIANPGHVVAGR